MRSPKPLPIVALAVFVVMALVAAVPFWLDRSTTAALQELRAELEQQQRLDSILDGLRDAETAQRGFVITANEAFLAPYRQAEQALPGEIREAKDKARNDAERAAVYRIARLAELKMAELQETIAMRRMDGFAATERVVATMRGKLYMDELRQLIGAQQARTQARREQLRATMLGASSRSYRLSLGATVVNILVLGALLAMLARMLRERKRNARALEGKAAELAAAVEQADRLNRELRVIADMLRAVEALPSSLDSGEAVARAYARLLPGVAGSFFVQGEGGETLHRLAQWEGASRQPAQLALEDCWGLRHGAHYRSGVQDGPPCMHFRGDGGHDDGATRLCIPLVTHEELVGLLHLEGIAHERGAREEQERIAVGAAEQLALALGNARLRESLRRQSVLDPLTGLFNRRYLDETFKRELARARRKQTALALVVLDVDHFKAVNDGYGHAAGDAVLRAIAQLVRQSIRDCDVACRYGGEELVVLMPDCALADAVERAHGLRAEIAAATPAAEGAGPAAVTASFGVAAYPQHGLDADALFWAADKALYKAKRDGRNRVEAAGTP